MNFLKACSFSASLLWTRSAMGRQMMARNSNTNNAAAAAVRLFSTQSNILATRRVKPTILKPIRFTLHDPVYSLPEGLMKGTMTMKSRRTGVIARKIGMIALYDNYGTQIPCTVLQMQDVEVVQFKPEMNRKGHMSVQIGSKNKSEKRVNKPMLGHFRRAKVKPKYKLMEFKVTPDAYIPEGTPLSVMHFVPGQFVDCQGVTIGKGFQGVMKRHGFKGMRASHGTSLTHRSLGSTGSNTSPGRVFKGKRMPGRMGGKKRSVQSLQVLKLDTVLNLIYVRGHVPGHENSWIRVIDARRKNPARLDPPMPTYIPDGNPVPRELVPIQSKPDPFHKYIFGKK